MNAIRTKQDKTPRVCDRILRRVRAWGRGAVFTWKDFADLGSPAAVRQALSRLVKRGKFRRVARGVYDFPVTMSSLGITVAPDVTSVIEAVARHDNARLQVSGAQAANALGLSTQVPGKTIYLSSGRSHRICLGRQIIELRHAPPPVLAGAGKTSGLVISALAYLGQDDIADDDIARLSHLLSDDDKLALKQDAGLTFPWIASIVDQIVNHN